MLDKLKKQWYYIIGRYIHPIYVFKEKERFFLLTDEEVISILEDFIHRVEKKDNAIARIFFVIIRDIDRHYEIMPLIWIKRYLKSLVRVGRYHDAIDILQYIRSKNKFAKLDSLEVFETELFRSLLEEVTRKGYCVNVNVGKLYNMEEDKYSSLDMIPSYADTYLCSICQDTIDKSVNEEDKKFLSDVIEYQKKIRN